MTGDPTDLIAAFLREIGVSVEHRALDAAETFLPGIAVERGGLVVDEAHLTYPGDLLHEAAHIAVAPPRARPDMTGDIAVEGLDMTQLETAAVPWSYAAALHAGIDPAVVFHGGGYRGKSQGLLATFAVGVYPGLNLLEAWGMAAGPRRAAELDQPPFPHMLHWLRPEGA